MLGALLGVLLIIYAAGTGFQNNFRVADVASSGVSRDGWFQQGATLEIPELFSRSNQLKLKVSENFPIPGGKADLLVRICGADSNQLSVTAGSEQTIYLTGNCEPRKVEFISQQVFTPGTGDNRQLVFQVTDSKVVSALGVPLLRCSILSKLVLAFLFIWTLLWLFLSNVQMARGIAASAIAIVFAGLAAWSLAQSWAPADFIKLTSVWIVLSAVLLGRLFGQTQLTVLGQSSARFDWRDLSAILLITLVAFLFRFFDLGFGLPETYHPDEVPKYNAIMRMRSYGDFNPRYFLHPTLLLYSTYFSNVVLHTFGFVSGSFESTLIFSGRVVSTLAGGFSCLLVFLIGRRLFGFMAGLFGGFLLAVLPLHITCSRYVKEDILMTFWFLLTVYFVVRALQAKRGAILLLAGVFAGLAFSTKYTGLLSIVAIVTCPWALNKSLMPDRYWLRWSVRAVFVFGLTFLAASPYIILDLGTFLHDFGYEQRHMLRGHTTAVSAWSEYWVFHVARSLIPGMSFGAFLLALIGFGLLTCRKDRWGWYVIGLALLYYLPAEWVKAKPEPQPERYVVPCLPFLAVCAGYALSRITNRFKILGAFVGLLVLLPVFWRSVNLAADMTPDSRQVMKAWIYQNVPAGSKIALDWRPYNPAFADDRYEIFYIPRDNTIAELSFARLEAQGVDYLLLSSLFYGRYFKQPVEASLREHFRKIFRSGRAINQTYSEHGTYGFHNPAITLFAVSPRAQARFKAEMSVVPYTFSQGY